MALEETEMSYTGVYDKTIYYNPVSKYCVISVKTNDQTIPQKARSAFQHRDRLIRFTAVGYELPQTDRVSMILNGEWQNGKYGQQLQVLYIVLCICRSQTLTLSIPWYLCSPPG